MPPTRTSRGITTQRRQSARRAQFNPGAARQRADRKFTYELEDDVYPVEFYVSSFNDGAYHPPFERRIPQEGAWVMLLRPPLIACAERLDRGQIFYARHPEDADE